MTQQENAAVRSELIGSLEKISRLKAFGALTELMQGESLVLQYLAAHREETVFPSVLSDACRLSRSRITGALNSLERKGCICMEHASHDRRMVQVCITGEGLARIGEQMENLTAYFDKMISGVGTEEIRRLTQLIDRCVAVMED